MHESPVTNMQEFVWRRERETPPMRHGEVEQALVAWQQHRWSAGRPSFRAALARTLIALATRLAPATRTNLTTTGV